MSRLPAWKRFVLFVCLSGCGAALLLSAVSATPPGRPARELPSVIVSPPPVIPLRFSHAKHQAQGVKCGQCHPKAKRSTRSADLLLPGKKVCLECHDEAAVPKGHGRLGQTSTKTCKKCHLRFNLKGFPARVVWRKPRFTFNHKLHVGQEHLSCETCHKGVAKAGYKGGLHLPKMAICLDCHNKKKNASTRCLACHERQPGGKMRVRYPGGNLKPGPSLPHLDHGATFRTSHKVAARAYKKQCDTCHQRATCLRCHGGVRKPASIHLGNYILRHGRDARANRSRCKSCHTRQRFCVSCHSRVGLNRRNRQSPYRTPALKRYHGANWASSTAVGNARNRHATHARRNVSTCVSCHRERDCTTCHARKRVGGLGRSPHRPGFARSRRCKILLKKNFRACLKCHGFGDPLMTMCR